MADQRRVRTRAESTETRDRAICDRVAEARERAELTQKELAELLDVGLRTYQNYEDTLVPWSRLLQISTLTGQPVEWLLRGEDGTLTPDRKALREELENFAVARISRRIDRLEKRLTERD